MISAISPSQWFRDCGYQYAHHRIERYVNPGNSNAPWCKILYCKWRQRHARFIDHPVGRAISIGAWRLYLRRHCAPSIQRRLLHNRQLGRTADPPATTSPHHLQAPASCDPQEIAREIAERIEQIERDHTW
jgi:hypothetical protein